MDDRQKRKGGKDVQKAEPARSRWTPKPEQILILESIFNGGLVNPPREETIRIRQLLEKFGAVGDANIFYWFQNRRSRSRRKQREQQANLAGGEQPKVVPACGSGEGGGSVINYSGGGIGVPYDNYVASGFVPNSQSYTITGPSSSSCSGLEGYDDALFSLSAHLDVVQELEQNPIFFPTDASIYPIQPGMITVFINGIATEVGRGPLDSKALFGEDFVLVHSSGFPVPLNEYGVMVQGLQHGESYFLVPTQPV